MSRSSRSSNCASFPAPARGRAWRRIGSITSSQTRRAGPVRRAVSGRLPFALFRAHDLLLQKSSRTRACLRRTFGGAIVGSWGYGMISEMRSSVTSETESYRSQPHRRRTRCRARLSAISRDKSGFLRMSQMRAARSRCDRVSPLWPVMSTTGSSGRIRCKATASSVPVMPGMISSVRSRSNRSGSARNAASALAPLSNPTGS